MEEAKRTASPFQPASWISWLPEGCVGEVTIANELPGQITVLWAHETAFEKQEKTQFGVAPSGFYWYHQSD
jgi:hypothetical protein